MPRLTYREKFDVYRVDADENSPEDWVLIGTDLAASVKPMGAFQSLQENAAFNVDNNRRFNITHRGRCMYNSLIECRPDARLLVSQEDGKQYLVVAARQGRRYRGGHGALTMALAIQEPPTYRLKRT